MFIYRRSTRDLLDARRRLKERILRDRRRRYICSDWWQIGRYKGYTGSNTKLVLALVLGLLAISAVRPMPVRADDFYPSKDTMGCEFVQGISVSYRFLPPVGTGAGQISYDPSDVVGEADNFPGSHTFLDIGQITSPGAGRFNGIADFVAVPPETKVDFGLFVVNLTGHEVSLDRGWIAVSKTNPDEGDLTRLGARGFMFPVEFLYRNQSVTRMSKMYMLPMLGTWMPSDILNPPWGITVGGFETIRPVHFENKTVGYRYEPDGSLSLDYSLALINVSDYFLEGIKVDEFFPNGLVYSFEFNIEPHSHRDFSYSVNLGFEYEKEIYIPPTVLSDPNRHRESVSNGTEPGAISFEPESRTLFTYRGDFGAPSSWTAVQPDFAPYPEGEFIEVELIPYSIRSEDLWVRLPIEVYINKVVTDDDESRVKRSSSKAGEVLEYHISVRNNGAAIENVVLKDIFDPSSLDVVDLGDFTLDGGELTVNLGRLEHGYEGEFAVRFVIKDNLPTGEYIIDNIARLSCDESECLNLSSEADSVVIVGAIVPPEEDEPPVSPGDEEEPDVPPELPPDEEIPEVEVPPAESDRDTEEQPTTSDVEGPTGEVEMHGLPLVLGATGTQILGVSILGGTLTIGILVQFKLLSRYDNRKYQK